MRYSTQPQFTSLIPPTFTSGFRNDSDFVQPTKFTSPLRRSYDALNDFADMQQSFPTTRPYPSEQQQQQQPYYRSTYQTQHQPQSQQQQQQPQQQQQQQQQPGYANQAYINPNIVYTNEYGVPVDHYRPTTFQGTGGNACKSCFVLIVHLQVTLHFISSFKKNPFLYLIRQDVVDPVRKIFLLLICIRKSKKTTPQFYFQIS